MRTRCAPRSRTSTGTWRESSETGDGTGNDAGYLQATERLKVPSITHLAGCDGLAAAEQPRAGRGRGNRDRRRLRAALAAALLRVCVEADRERRAHLHRLLRVPLQPRW